MRIKPDEGSLTWMHNCTCIYSEMGACTPECCGSVSYGETERSPRVRDIDRLVTQVRWARAQKVDPQDSPTASAVVSASSDSSLSALDRWSRSVRENSPGFHLKLCFPLYNCIPATQFSHLLLSMSTHVLGRLNQRTSCMSKKKVFSSEHDLITRPVTPFSPGLPYVSSWRSQSASICISCTVILMPLILKLQFPTSHIFSLFPGFIQVSLILACVRLFEVGLFFRTHSPTEDNSSDLFTTLALFESHCCRWDQILSHVCCGSSFTIIVSMRVAKTTERPVMILVNFLISQPFALQVVSVSFFPPASLRASMCSDFSLSRCSQLLCSNRKADQ